MSNVANFQTKAGLYPDGIIGPLTTEAMRREWMITKTELAHFLGQSHVETGGFLRFEENLNYSAQRLLEIFPKYFTPELARRYARNAEMIANVAYSNRMGNGDICSGDGFKYRGRWAMQLTGKTNYAQISRYLSNPLILENPDAVGDSVAWISGLSFFDINNIWDRCRDISDTSIINVTIKVNGGTTDLERRIQMTNHYFNMQT